MSEKEQYYFGLEKKRYVTRGISELLPDEYIFLLWQWIDCLVLEKGKDVDYLQVFDFEVVTEDGKVYQQITHSQEVPEYKVVYRLEVIGNGITGKVFVIDDSQNCTMLWNYEY